MNYNMLNYPGSTASVRNPSFSTVISNTNPDILVVQEITSQAGVNGFLNNVLIPFNPYPSSPFILPTSAACNLTYEEVEIIDSEIGKIINKTDYENFEIR